MNEQITQLQNQINILQTKIDNLERSSAIPRQVETALRERLGSINPKNSTGAVAVTAIGGAAAFNLPNTTGTIQIVSNGKIYNVLYQ